MEAWQVQDRDGTDWLLAVHPAQVPEPSDDADDSAMEALDRAAVAGLEGPALAGGAAFLLVRSIRSHLPKTSVAAWIVTATSLDAGETLGWTTANRKALDQVIEAIEAGALPPEVRVEGRLPIAGPGPG
jgi:hypothetical protein